MNQQSKPKTPTQTGFRRWLKILEEDVRGYQPLWPSLLGATLNDEFERQREIDASYSEDVFKDRDNHTPKKSKREENSVAELYHLALNVTDGCVTFRNERIWLLGYQWPTQGGKSEKSRRADLVGIREDGALVVFEAKVANGTAPLKAIMEGLDYLACLVRSANFDKITSGFTKWKLKEGKAIPAGFEQSTPCQNKKPTLVVLAPDKYFEKQSRSVRGRDWPFLTAISETMIKSVRLEFACTDFSSVTLRIPPKPKKINWKA